MVFSSSHVWMWELDYKESWTPKNCCFWTVVLQKTPESPLDCKEIQPVNPEGNQSWIFIGKTDAEAEAPILSLATSWEEWTHWKRPWCWERLKAGGEGDNRWMRWLDCITDSMDMSLSMVKVLVKDREALHAASPRSPKTLDMTKWLNWTEPTLMTEELVWTSRLVFKSRMSDYSHSTIPVAFADDSSKMVGKSVDSFSINESTFY